MSRFTKCRADIKIVVIGNSGTGKTSFCKKWINDTFDSSYKATVMSDFSYKIHEFEGNFYKIQFWDIAGQDKNIYASKVFTKNSHGCLVFSDITDKETLKKALLWKKAIDDNTLFIDGDLLPSLLILNKSDLANEELMKNDDEMNEFVKENKFNNFFRTSCVNGYGINEAIDYILKIIVKRLEEYHKKTNTSFDEEKRTSIVVQTQVKKNEFLINNRSCCGYI
jgi:Ras-related protein Rab-7A